MDWSSLPPELLRLVSNKLSDLAHFIRFRAVCHNWRSAAQTSDPPPQLPWFLETHEFDAAELRFYSVFSGEVLTVHVPSSYGKWVSGSSHDYLVTSRWRSGVFSLLNPLTKREVQLPFLDVKRPAAVWVGPDSAKTDDYLVVIHGNKVKPKTQIISFNRNGNNMKNQITIEGGSCRSCFYNGMYFSLRLISKEIEVFDISTQTLRYVISPPETEGPFFPPGASTYIVVSAGEILRVLQHYDKYLPVEKCKFDIHKLDFGSESKKPFWVKIDSIGDQMLFLDALNGFSVSASCFDGFRGNYIYFLKEIDQGNEYFSSYTLCKYDITDRKAEELSCPFVEGGTWLVPSLC
ncbi:hypothetical protein LUZ60_016133 [Juncus effusus]|nr:hypothetical protein LUZ60_016133 [Juncus effusus]